MNDFTKEELKEILACVCNIDGNVLAKLQSMINNYCEHEYSLTINGACCSLICSKCNKVYINE